MRKRYIKYIEFAPDPIIQYIPRSPIENKDGFLIFKETDLTYYGSQVRPDRVETIIKDFGKGIIFTRDDLHIFSVFSLVNEKSLDELICLFSMFNINENSDENEISSTIEVYLSI